MHCMTAAHSVLPLNTMVKVTNLANNREVVVRVNDRGPFVNDRVIDLSLAAARILHGAVRDCTGASLGDWTCGLHGCIESGPVPVKNLPSSSRTLSTLPRTQGYSRSSSIASARIRYLGATCSLSWNPDGIALPHLLNFRTKKTHSL